jgi:(1->4)-alpha-D-glucan 1-alpha-D-glucosylmutase
MMRIPIATYRVQFNPSFSFGDAQEIVPYLGELGISDIYASPVFKARPGTIHGYDVVDMNQLNPELGGLEGFEELNTLVREHGMGWVQDIIPNHMAYTYENQMLMDVLENGKGSPYFNFFDIEWDHSYESIRGRLLAPFLGGFYGEALENGEIQLQYDQNGMAVNYHTLRLPLKVESYVNVLTYQLDGLEGSLGEDNPDFIKFLGILYVLRNLPSGKQMDARYDQIRFAKRILWELYTKNREIKRFIDGNIRAFCGEKDNPESFNLLDSLLSEQFFRLSFWKVATEEINYRRFFNINELICLRSEDGDVFNNTHSLIFNLIAEGKATGLRIDHIDGLYDPTAYLEKVRENVGELYVVVEKILHLKEELPSFWPVQGTTGYGFLNYANGVFCQGQHQGSFNRIYSQFTGQHASYEDLVADKKRLIIGRHMAADVDNLALLMKRISGRYRHGGDITLYGLKRTLVEVMAQFPIYRTYISRDIFREADRGYIEQAISKAAQSNPGLLNELAFIEKFLLLHFDDYLGDQEKKEWVNFVMRFQQFTGPLMAKGFEDTVLYVYNRLLSLNEVGGSPDTFGIPLDEFHDFNKKRAALWPHTLNTTSTHDTKRGEDVRARINVLSEIPREWNRALKRWSALNKGKRRRVNNVTVPDRNDEYFLYQTLIGALPFEEREYPAFIVRVKEYIIKAVREAKVHTAWLKPDAGYEDAYTAFVEEILTRSEHNQFLGEFLPFQKKVAFYGIFNSLSQTLIKATSPGVPDFYQGTELWDLNLVDPDNRRPVDFETRRMFLRDIKARSQRDISKLIDELLSNKEDGRIKLFVIYRALQGRRQNRPVFQEGRYVPLRASGRLKAHIIAFARNHEEFWAITIAPRFFTSLIGEGEAPVGQDLWGDTIVTLPGGAPALWRDAMSDRVIKGRRDFPVGEALRCFPVSLLIGEVDR